MNRLLVGIMLLAIVCIAGSCKDEDEYTKRSSFQTRTMSNSFLSLSL